LCSAGYTGFEGRNPHERTNKTVRSTGDEDEVGLDSSTQDMEKPPTEMPQKID